MRKLFCLAFLISLFHFVSAQKNNQQEVSAIKTARMASNKFIAEHNIEGLAKFLLDDFVQVRGNATHLTGKDNILASWAKLFISNPKVSYVRNPTEIIISDNDTLAWETGKWIGINSYSKGGNYSAMWRKWNGEWKLQAELFVSLND